MGASRKASKANSEFKSQQRAASDVSNMSSGPSESNSGASLRSVPSSESESQLVDNSIEDSFDIDFNGIVSTTSKGGGPGKPGTLC